MFRRFKDWLEKRSEWDLKDPFVRYVLGGFGPTAAGVDVTPETAMRCSAVYGSVKAIAESVQLLPLHLYRRTDDGKERAKDHPVSSLLTTAANEWTSASEFRLVMTTQFALHGRAFAYIERDETGRPAALFPLDSRNVTVKTNPVTMERSFVVAINGRSVEYDHSQILHLRAVGGKIEDGDSPVTLGREAIGLALIMEKHAARLFGQGARPGGVFKHPGKLKDEAIAKRLREQFEQMYAGGDNAGKTAILEDGMSFEAVQLTSVDAQFLELRKHQTQEVSRFWRVPLHLLNDMERATHNNAEHMGQQFLTYCLLPILRMWQDAVHMSLLTPAERSEYFCEFMVDDIARADIGTRFTAYGQAINSGILNPNEVRALENRGPYEGGEVYMRALATGPAPTTTNGTGGDDGDANA